MFIRCVHFEIALNMKNHETMVETLVCFHAKSSKDSTSMFFLCVLNSYQSLPIKENFFLFHSDLNLFEFYKNLPNVFFKTRPFLFQSILIVTNNEQ